MPLSRSSFRSSMLGCGLALATAAAPAWADVSVYMHGFGQQDTYVFDPVTLSRSNTFDPALNFYAGQNFASANLATGALKVSASAEVIAPFYFDTCGLCPQVYAKLNDTLTFQGPGSTVVVTMSVHLDGSFAASGSTGLAQLDVAAQLVLGGQSAQIILDRLYVPAGNHFYAPANTLNGTVNGKPGSYVVVTGLNMAEGTAILSGTFSTNTTYSMSLGLELQYGMLEPGTVAAADFSHTALVSISMPAGYSYSSGSGVFLTSAVPEPGSLPLYAAGLAAVGVALRRRRPPG